MGHTSQSGEVIFKTQAAFDTPVSAATLASDGMSVKLRSGSLGGSRDFLVPDPEIGGGRDISDGYNGTFSVGGDLEFYLRFRAITLFLKNALGSAVTEEHATSAGAYEHTITPVDGQLPFMTVYEKIGSGLERIIYSDVVINTLHLESDANGYVQGTIGVIGRNATPNVANIVSTIFDNSNMAVGTSVEIRYDGVKMPAKSWSLDIANGYEDDNYYVGSFFLGDLTAKRREITASVTVRHETNAFMRQALYGTPTATAVGGVTTKKPFSIIMKSYEDIPGVTPPIPFSLEITSNKTAFEPFAYSPSGDDALENDITLRMLRPDTSLPIIEAVVINDLDVIP